MPTPVDVARQFLAEPAVSVLEDAVAVAKRRGHSQTTSLHIISALLVLPSSTLREACTFTKSSASSPRLKFRALELCVGIALDRVSVSKSTSDDPPVSNSLMAAIKRSQANQKRHPETFHLYQQQQLNSNPQTSFPSISSVKVELKHFVMSILDDPIVSRVLSGAGFQTHEIKMAVLNPLNLSRFSSINSRAPPLFSCSPSDFPFSKPTGTERFDANSRRIADILSKSSKRNPLLVGAYASDAYRIFIDCLKTGRVPKEIDGVSVVSIEDEISCSKQVNEMVKNCHGPGIVVTCGDLKVFTGVESVDYMFSELKRLVMNHGRKLWVIGFVAGDGDYKKLVERFPSIEMDWDLQLMPVTTASKSFESGLLRSFVPLGGFFSMPSENESLTAPKSSKLCNLCNEKYKGQVSDDKQSISPSSWLQISECETSKRSLTTQAKTLSDPRVMGLKRKWSDICRKLHSSFTSQEDITSRVGSLSNGPKPIFLSGRVNTQAEVSVQDLEMNGLQRTMRPRMPCTNLRLGLLYDSAEKETYAKDLDKPWAVLAEKIYWQTEVIRTISQTLSRCRNGKRNGNVWLGFVGSDKVGKRRISSGVAEIVFGRKENLIYLDLMSQDAISPCNSIIDCYDSNCHKLESGRKMIVDHLADELSKHPHSVVLLENVDKADFLVRESLLRAIETCKFSNSHGREITINNNVFVLASDDVSYCERVASDFPENKILKANNLQMQILVGSSCGNIRKNMTTNVSVTSSKITSKRKSSNNDLTEAEVSKRRCLFSRSIIDLNLPVEDIEEDCDNTKSDRNSDESKVWLKELLEHVDERVVFRPFDFDSLSQKILKEVEVRLREVGGGATFRLEIDEQVMLQILAAAWVTERGKALEDWIEQVLCVSIDEARQRCTVDRDVVMKLVPSYDEGLAADEQAAGLCLPARINVN